MLKYIKRKVAVIVTLCLLVSYVKMPNTWTQSNGMDVASAETISEEVEWNIKCMNAENSYEESKNLTRIKVAVLDSGLDYDEDIPFVERKDFLEEEELHPIYQDYTGHGTSVAGLICATKNDDRLTGIAANVDLYVGRILDAENKAPVERVIQGIEWAMEQKVNIIHMSYGTKEYSEELEEVIQRAYKQGILLIAAAGNSGTAPEDESTIEYPAAFDNVISVGATNTENVKTEISSSGEELDVVAPGDQILSTGAFGGVVVEEGTSVSAAQVTGVAAVIWGKHPDKTNEFIKGLLVGSANATAVNENCGNGMVDYEQSNDNYGKMNAMYSVFKKLGVSEQSAVEMAEKSLGKNTKVVEKSDDVNYVNGAWGKDKHKSFVEESNTNGIESSNLTILKNAVQKADTVNSVSKLGTHPYFHGGGNYIANTQYLFSVAQYYFQNQEGDLLPEYSVVFGKDNPYKRFGIGTKSIKENEEDMDIKRYLQQCINRSLRNGKEWDFFVNCTNKKNPNNMQKGFAILGLAIHNATDSFSHSGYRLTKYGWKKIIHPNSQIGRKDTVSYIYEQLSKGINDKETREYYKCLLEETAVADRSDILPIRAELGAGVAKKIIQGRKSKQLKICSCFLKTIKSKEKEKYKFSLYNLNIYWQSVSEKKIYFKLGLDIGEYMFNVPKNEDIIIINAKGKRPKIVVQNTKSYYEYILFSGKKGSQGIAFDKMKKGNDLIYTVPQKKELSTSDLSLLITDGKTKKWKKFNYNCKVTYVSKKNPKIKLRIKKQTVLWGETLKLPWYKKRVKKKKYKKSYKGFYVCDSKYYVIGSKLKYLPKGKMKFTLKIK